MEIANSLLIICINLCVTIFLINKNWKTLNYSFYLAVLFIILNLIIDDFPLKLIPIILFYSLAILILSFMSNQINIINNNSTVSELTKMKLAKIKFYFISFVLPILITIFQIIFLLSAEMQNEILTSF